MESFCATLKGYGIASVTGDRYGGSWVSEAFSKGGITYAPSPMTKSEIYQTLLSLINSGLVKFPDNEKLIFQLGRLERRPSRTGQDLIAVPQHESDDVANAVAGALGTSESPGCFDGSVEGLLCGPGYTFQQGRMASMLDDNEASIPLAVRMRWEFD